MLEHLTARALLPMPALIALALVGCARFPRLPGGADGYQCSRHSQIPNGFVSASAYPDYLGGYVSLSLSWEQRIPASGAEVRIMVSKSGLAAFATRTSLTAVQLTQGVPPLGTRTTLRLSSGETIASTFIDEKMWRLLQRYNIGYGNSVTSDSPDFIQAFVRASWADIDVVDRQGASLEHRRIDLSEAAEQLGLMRELGAQVEAAVADYVNQCTAFHIVTAS